MKNERHILTHFMLERLSLIHKKILDHEYPNTTELAKFFEVGTATISRDIEFLRDRFKAPIEYDSARRGYYYSTNFEMPFETLTLDDAGILSSAKALLENFRGTPVFDEISEVIDAIVDSKSMGSSSVLPRIAAPLNPRINVDENVWQKVYKALNENRLLTFTYQGRWNTEKTRRTVEPYQILIEDGACYLFAFCKLRNAERLFCLNQMEDLEIESEIFELPEDFEFSSRDENGYFGAFSSDEEYDFKINFYGDSRLWVKNRLWAQNQKITEVNDGGEEALQINFRSNQYLKVKEWLFSQGANARPLEPDWLVAEWKENAMAILERVGVKYIL